MYVCLCNRITDSEIRRHASVSVCTPGAVYRARGVAPRCGKCIPMLRSILQRLPCLITAFPTFRISVHRALQTGELSPKFFVLPSAFSSRAYKIYQFNSKAPATLHINFSAASSVQ